ncbi:MAG: DUF937 domain-containing protein [Bacteroidales bacterium]|nr:DUF937 domain-containing protein [Bacteroidales bacterium]
MDLTSLLSSPIGQGVIQTVSSQLGMNQKQASSAVNVAVPAILAGLMKNARTSQGAESLNKALESKHDGSLLDNLAGLFQSQSGALQQDGNSILEHIFGSNRAAVEKGVAQQSGLSLDKVKPLLAILAPIVMAYVGKQKRQSKTASGGLGDLLGGLLSAGAPSKKVSGGLLDAVGGLLGGGSKKSSGGLIDDILGGLLK